jgi:leucyl aminopeptidase (aminopeptidase T)
MAAASALARFARSATAAPLTPVAEPDAFQASLTPVVPDEKIGGTVHLALGRSYPETGGKNVSALHWDLICDLRAGGRITADGVTIQENGRFA